MSTILTDIDVAKIALKTASGLLKIQSLVPVSENPIFIDDACQITGYAKDTIYALVFKKQMPFHKVARRRKLFFYKSELLAWMENKQLEVSHG